MAKDPKTLTLSPTKIDTFYGCRRLFKYTYLSQPFKQKDNKYFVIGNIAHKVLEDCHKVGMSSKINWRKDASHFFKKAYATYKVKEKLKSGMLEPDDVKKIKMMLKKYIEYIKSLEEPPNVFSVEKLAKIAIGGAVVWLKSDRVDKLGENHYRVVDYKSGQVASKKAELASVQLPSYGIWVRQKIDPDAKVSGMYIYLKEVDKKKGRHEYEISEAMMEEAEEKYSNVRKLLSNGCEYSQNFDYKYCFHCDYKRFCVKDENDEL